MPSARILLSGFGKMGRAVYEEARQSQDFQVASVIDQVDPRIPGLQYFSPSQIREAVSSAGVAIDFSSPEFAVNIARQAASQKKNFLIGTTGLSEAQLSEIRAFASSNSVSAIVSPNFSLGVNAFFEIVSFATRLLSGYDAEIVETHHSQKKDSPSGTALRTADAILGARGLSRDKLVYGRNGLQQRTRDEVGVHSIRQGQVVGEHEVLFAGNNEVVRLSHSALSRQCFAAGCLASAKWLYGKMDGKIYSVSDVLKSSK